MFFVSGHENEQRRIDLHHALHDRKAVESGHLDVEEDEIGLLGLDLADRFAPIGAGFDDLDVGKLLEPELEPLDSQFLVIDEDRANGHESIPKARCAVAGAGVTDGTAGGFAKGSGAASTARSNGISITTVKPPAAGVRISNR